MRARTGTRGGRGPAPGAPWEQGTDSATCGDLLGYWATVSTGGRRKRWPNGFCHFRAGIDGVRVNFVHERPQRPRDPADLDNAWPNSFAEFLPLAPRPTYPAAHGIDGTGSDVVILSPPGYGFSDRPARTRVTSAPRRGCGSRHDPRLGYQRYGAHGGDFSGPPSPRSWRWTNSRPCSASTWPTWTWPPTPGRSRPLSAAEARRPGPNRRWREEDRGYGAIQSRGRRPSAATASTTHRRAWAAG